MNPNRIMPSIHRIEGESDQRVGMMPKQAKADQKRDELALKVLRTPPKPTKAQKPENKKPSKLRGSRQACDTK